MLVEPPSRSRPPTAPYQMVLLPRAFQEPGAPGTESGARERTRRSDCANAGETRRQVASRLWSDQNIAASRWQVSFTLNEQSWISAARRAMRLVLGAKPKRDVRFGS